MTLNQLLNCKRVVGFDINPKMIEFANQNYGSSNQGVTFKGCDAAATWGQFTEATGVDKDSTDLVFSVHCFHWIPVDQQPQAMSNLATLLKKGNQQIVDGSLWLLLTMVVHCT